MSVQAILLVEVLAAVRRRALAPQLSLKGALRMHAEHEAVLHTLLPWTVADLFSHSSSAGSEAGLWRWLDEPPCSHFMLALSMDRRQRACTVSLRHAETKVRAASTIHSGMHAHQAPSWGPCVTCGVNPCMGTR